MKTNKLLVKYSFVLLLIILALLSIAISVYTYLYYVVVSKGIVGCVTLYLILYFVKNTNIDIPLREVLIHPNKEKYLFYALVIPAISCWTVIQIFEMILFFYRQVK